jgi:hypothetical protein
MFVSLLDVHILHDIVAVPHDGIGDFVSNFVSHMRIHRGVRDVAKLHWPEIQKAGLDLLLHLTQWIGDSDVSHSGQETAELRAVPESSPNNSTTCVQACLQALSWAQWVLNLKATVPQVSSKRVHAMMTWPLMVCEDYVDSL